MYDMYNDLPYGQYIWNGTLGDVQEYISKIPDGETLDIRRCRFDPSCISVIMNNIPRIKVINMAWYWNRIAKKQSNGIQKRRI